MNYQERIVSNPSIMLGKPLIKGTRITVELLFKKLSEGVSTDQLLNMYPQLSKADVLAAFHYVSDRLSNEEVILNKAS